MPNQSVQQDIIKELGIDSLPPAKQQEVLTVMTEAILKRLTLRLLESLSEAQRQELEQVSAAGDTEKVSQFLMANVPGYEGLIQDEVGKFKQEMMQTVDALLAA